MKKMEKSVFRPMGQRNYEPPMTQVIVVEAQSVLCASVPDYGFVGRIMAVSQCRKEENERIQKS